ncbi:GH39 family glycosyl hydrolase [Yinghuangia sp. YIM S10712]|uniref:GH39 family glycosyl hydrolase n=1 Tax=Yinghuangia sp. YIM S10712 TaxID=3436930 RepID=UPI003F534CDA
MDFGARQGELPRPEKYNNFGNAAAWPQQRADDVAYLNEQGLHGEVYRVWLSNANAPGTNVFDTCELATQTCDFSAVDAYLTQASSVSDSLLVNLSPSAFVRGRRPLAELRPMLELILRNLKEKYPDVKYVEAFNEPDWQFHGQERRAGRPADQTTLQPGDLYRFYAPFYEAVGDVNKNVRRGDRIQVGGPALMWMDPKWMEPFLDDFAADRNPRKRLDFISYHAYLSWDDKYQTPTRYVSDLSAVASQRRTLAGWLKQRRLDTDLPAFITETGIYPGPSFDDTDPRNDYVRQAAAMATYSYLYANQPDTYMFNWCVRHFAEERKDQFVTRTPDGPLTDTFTPYGNMLLMQSRMKDTRVSAVSDNLEGDNGIYATASKDRTGASLMVWNWQHVNDTSYRTTVDMTRLPSELRHGPVRRQLFRIDQTTSNYFTDPTKADLQLVDDKIVKPGKTYTETIDLAPNAIYLILLEPVRR